MLHPPLSDKWKRTLYLFAWTVLSMFCETVFRSIKPTEQVMYRWNKHAAVKYLSNTWAVMDYTVVMYDCGILGTRIRCAGQATIKCGHHSPREICNSKLLDFVRSNRKACLISLTLLCQRSHYPSRYRNYWMKACVHIQRQYKMAVKCVCLYHMNLWPEKLTQGLIKNK